MSDQRPTLVGSHGQQTHSRWVRRTAVSKKKVKEALVSNRFGLIFGIKIGDQVIPHEVQEEEVSDPVSNRRYHHRDESYF